MVASLCFVLIILFPAESCGYISGALYVGTCVATETRAPERNQRIGKGLYICFIKSHSLVISVSINYVVLHVHSMIKRLFILKCLTAKNLQLFSVCHELAMLYIIPTEGSYY